MTAGEGQALELPSQEMGLRPKTPSKLRPGNALEAVKESAAELALGCLSVGLRGRQHVNSMADRLACGVGLGTRAPSLLGKMYVRITGLQSV